MRTLCAVVLAFEAVVIGLAVPVAIQLGGYPPALAGGVWGGLAAAALLLAAVQRFRWGYYAGWVLQVLFVLSGVLVSGLAILSVIFVGLWVAAIVVGTRTDHAADDAPEEAGGQPESSGTETGDGARHRP